MGDSYTYHIAKASEAKIGSLRLGAGRPVVLQSMANTDTNDVEASVAQAKQIIEKGGQLVRFTTQGIREAESLGKIDRQLRAESIETPLVADVHFRANVADAAAEVCQKVRINPGNFTEKKDGAVDFSEEEFAAGVALNRERLVSLIAICKKNSTALRIGVNHGSLSRRIMSKYGDTPKGMVESTLEFLRVCKEVDFPNVVVSLKSSNTRLMVQAVRLLVYRMQQEDLYYPVHLGVTESGDGLEGRIKSVVGIASLLQEGIGDTIRVSLTEPPEDEIPVAKNIAALFPRPQVLPYHPFENLPWDAFRYAKFMTHEQLGVGGKKVPVVISAKGAYKDFQPDFQYDRSDPISSLEQQGFSFLNIADSPSEVAARSEDTVYVLEAGESSGIKMKNWLREYYAASGFTPVIVRKSYKETAKEGYALEAAGELGLLLIDGLISGVMLENEAMDDAFNNWLSFYVLQAARERISVVDYIACPSCGRTKFNIQEVLQQVKAATPHLKGLKIAVMGCVVNGPGEMADADYGYIGAGNGKVHIYKGKEAVLKNVKEEDAVERLLQLIAEQTGS